MWCSRSRMRRGGDGEEEEEGGGGVERVKISK